MYCFNDITSSFVLLKRTEVESVLITRIDVAQRFSYFPGLKQCKQEVKKTKPQIVKPDLCPHLQSFFYDLLIEVRPNKFGDPPFPCTMRFLAGTRGIFSKGLLGVPKLWIWLLREIFSMVGHAGPSSMCRQEVRTPITWGIFFMEL